MFIFEIPFGILLLIPIIILVLLKKKFPKKEKLSNKILYVILLVLISTMIYVLINGIGYPCPCGCGSEEIDFGLKGIISIFTKKSRYLLIYPFPYSTIIISIQTLIIHIIVLGIKFIKKKKMSK